MTGGSALCGVAALFAFAVARPAAAADEAPPKDTVRLKDGGLLRGTIIELVPRETVTIQLPNGETRKVSLSETQYVGPSSADAQEALPGRVPETSTEGVHIELASKVGGGGPSPNGAGGALNFLGFGLGARVGVTGMRFYGGASFLYYMGQGDTTRGLDGNSYNESVKSILGSAEVGYDVVEIPHLAIRPLMGVGLVQQVVNQACPFGMCPNAGVGGQSPVMVFVEPGLAILGSYEHWLLGGDAAVFYSPPASGSQAALTAHVELGYRF